MKISANQMEAAEEAAARAFEDRVCGYVAELEPEEHAAMGEQGVREMIRYAIARAATYDVESKEGICTYVGLMLAFGRDFDVDPALPWAGDILNGLETADVRMERLYEAALDQLDRDEEPPSSEGAHA